LGERGGKEEGSGGMARVRRRGNLLHDESEGIYTPGPASYTFIKVKIGIMPQLLLYDILCIRPICAKKLLNFLDAFNC